MKKRRLEIEYSYDFELIGVISSMKGYKLAWDINHHLGTRLTRQTDLSIQFGGRVKCEYVHFSYQSPLYCIRLFKNKPHDGERGKYLLVPEFPHVDYIILSQGADKIECNRFQQYLKDIPSIQLVAFIPLASLKSKDYFIF